MAIDIETLKNNCKDYARVNKSVEVLRHANGTNHYTQIAKLVEMHRTKVSGLLKKAASLGLATKTKNGNYKKVPGILGYMPKIKHTKNAAQKTVADIRKKLEKGKVSKKKALSPTGITIPTKVEASIEKMIRAYGTLYAVENALRQLIRKVLSSNTNWWKTTVPNGVQKEVTDVIAKSPYHAVIRNDELEYTHLSQLKEIIINKRNWNAFLPHLHETDKNQFAATINKAIPSRNAIGHCIPMKSTDLKVIDVRFDDILKMIK